MQFYRANAYHSANAGHFHRILGTPALPAPCFYGGKYPHWQMPTENTILGICVLLLRNPAKRIIPLGTKLSSPYSRRMNNHIKQECFTPDCGGTCNQCCLFCCKVCGGAEGSLPTECPGVRMTERQQHQVYYERLDYQAGEWIQKGGA